MRIRAVAIKRRAEDCWAVLASRTWRVGPPFLSSSLAPATISPASDPSRQWHEWGSSRRRSFRTNVISLGLGRYAATTAIILLPSPPKADEHKAQFSHSLSNEFEILVYGARPTPYRAPVSQNQSWSRSSSRAVSTIAGPARSKIA